MTEATKQCLWPLNPSVIGIITFYTIKLASNGMFYKLFFRVKITMKSIYNELLSSGDTTSYFFNSLVVSLPFSNSQNIIIIPTLMGLSQVEQLASSHSAKIQNWILVLQYLSIMLQYSVKLKMCYWTTPWRKQREKPLKMNLMPFHNFLQNSLSTKSSITKIGSEWSI
jgi:hypothetical protein